MLFNSWEFIILFFITSVLYFSIQHKYRALLLLVSSYLFYMAWRWDFAIIMLAVTLINYYSGIKIEASNSNKEKKGWLAFALITSLTPLFYFKYTNFFIRNINNANEWMGNDANYSLLKVILPVGISFFTFQALSYSLDVFYNKTKVERNVINFSVFVAFFPQLIAGPIERSSHLLHQFREKHVFSQRNFLEGSKLFIWGLFKKVVIADRLSFYVERIYESPELYSSSTLVVATLFFAIQIYCDFSGYSDMAIGTARILGFNLMQNFNLPYFASSISDFWKRWHISLSSWFGDYLYKPLGGSRVKYSRWLLNILIVFVLSGFWHGANWTFVIWGLLHAFFYFFESWGDKLLNVFKLLKIKKYLLYKLFKIISVFVLVCYAWIFFRANTASDAFLISEKIFSNWDGSFYLGASTVTFALSILLIALLFFVQIMQYNGVYSLYFSKSKVPPLVESFWYVCLLLGISLFGVSSNSFIYFQF